jgi:hypothetical protein
MSSNELFPGVRVESLHDSTRNTLSRVTNAGRFTNADNTPSERNLWQLARENHVLSDTAAPDQANTRLYKVYEQIQSTKNLSFYVRWGMWFLTLISLLCAVFRLVHDVKGAENDWVQLSIVIPPLVKLVLFIIVTVYMNKQESMLTSVELGNLWFPTIAGFL